MEWQRHVRLAERIKTNGNVVNLDISLLAKSHGQSIGTGYTHYDLSSFNSLRSLTITTSGGYLALDNLSDSDSANSTTVPEPGTLAVFGLGLAGLAAVRRRKQQ